jgi:hypothetical protein
VRARSAAAIALLGACHARDEARPAAQARIAAAPGSAPAASSETDAAGPPSPPSPPSVVVESDWCVEDLGVLDEDLCYILPPLAEGKPRRLVVYLIGMVSPAKHTPQKDNVMAVVKSAMTRAGAAAILPRGPRGVGADKSSDWWTWPTSTEARADLVPGLVARWAEGRRKLEAIAGAPFERTYLAGSSNGAYFVSVLALRGDLDVLGFPVDGFMVASGGAAISTGARARPRPFYVGYGFHDRESMRTVPELVAALENARWPRQVSVHSFGHGARGIYLDEAFAFWDGARAPTAEAADPRTP